MRARVVIGANFGDEGKGLVTDYLCAGQGAGVVVRFNGGAQAGHTVVTEDGQRHVFHHFGSGTLRGIPTFLSQFFVCNPIIFFQELKEIVRLPPFSDSFTPRVYAHPDCLITTFADILINQAKEVKRKDKRHGSCGIGFHETIVRSRVPELKITMQDLWNGGRRLEAQMAEINNRYATFRTGKPIKEPEATAKFIKGCLEFANYVEPLGIGQCKDPVFEGSQGLLLDMDRKEFFPHVTHSKTGMHNVEILCAQAGITHKDIYYVSRTYLTRHGAGPLKDEVGYMAFNDDTNLKSMFQGPLRFAPLDIANVRARCYEDAGRKPFQMVLTHCDQLSPQIEAELYSTGPTRMDISNTLVIPETIEV